MILPLPGRLGKRTLIPHDRTSQNDYVSCHLVSSFASHRGNGSRHYTGPAGRSTEDQSELPDFGHDPPCGWLPRKANPESAYLDV